MYLNDILNSFYNKSAEDKNQAKISIMQIFKYKVQIISTYSGPSGLYIGNCSIPIGNMTSFLVGEYSDVTVTGGMAQLKRKFKFQSQILYLTPNCCYFTNKYTELKMVVLYNNRFIISSIFPKYFSIHSTICILFSIYFQLYLTYDLFIEYPFIK